MLKNPKGARDALKLFTLKNKALLILLVLVLFSSLGTHGLFLTYNNLSSVSRQIAVTTMIGLGFTVVLATGGVDLSAGHMLSFVGVVYAYCSLRLPLGLAFMIALALGVCCGFINGFISESFSLPPFIVSLATAQIYKSFAYLITNGKSIAGLGESVKYLGQGLVFGFIPISILIAIIIGAVLSVVMYRTAYGRYIIATGGKEEAAKVTGINTKAIKVSAYMLMGACVAIGATVLTGRVSMAAPGAGDGMEMDAIAAVVIGGTSMSGGKAKVGGTIFGCLVIGVMNNFLNLMNVSSFWQWFAKGCIIILAIILDSQTEKLINKRRTLA